MKKIALIIAILSCGFFFSQKSEKFIPVGYSSICCGPPSANPVMNYISDFQKKNRKKTIEVYKQSGLGREGEYTLYIGIDCLTKNKKQKFRTGLESVINLQNSKRNEGRDGSVAVDVKNLTPKTELVGMKNLTLFKNNLTK